MTSPFADRDARIALFQKWFSDTIPHSKALGLRVIDARRGFASMQLEWREELVGDPDTGVLASAVVISLMDNATSMAIWTRLNEFRPQVTMDLRVDYLRPSPKGARVFGRGVCYHLTHSVGFVRGVAHNGNIDEPLAHVSGTFIRVGDRLG